MKLTPIKALVPGKVMIGALIVIGLSVAWYLNQSGEAGEHLARRNFNHLNQLGENIAASIETVGRQVKFNLAANCLSDSSEKAEYYDEDFTDFEDASEARIKDVASCVKRRLKKVVDASPLVNDTRNIQVETDEFHTWQFGEPPPRPNAAGMCIPSDYYGVDFVDSTLAERGSVLVQVVVNHPASAIKVKAQKSSKRSVADITEAYCPPIYQRSFVAIELDLSLVQGLAQPEGYFNSIIIARTVHRHDSGKEHRDEDGDYGVPDLPEILFNSAESNYAAPAEDIRQIFRVQNSFGRLNSIFDLEYEEAARRERSSGFAELAEQKGEDKEVKIRPLQTSTIVPIDIGGFSQMAFVQPLHLEGVYEANEELVIIGLVGRSEFNKLKYAVPFNNLLLMLLVLFAGFLSLNFVRLLLLRRRAVLRKWDVYFSHLSMLGVAALFTVMLANWSATRDFRTQFDHDKASIAAKLVATFNAELGQKIAFLRRVGEHENGLREGADTSTFCKPASTPGKWNIGEHRKVECLAEGIPHASSVFELNDTGRQVGNYYSYNRFTTNSGFSVSQRRYFQAVLNNRAWEYQPLDDAQAEFRGQPFYIERIESLADGSLETGLSIPSPEADSLAGNGGPSVIAMGTRMHSLENVVLPPGYEFAIFENRTGRVLYHSVSRRSLRENFFHATDDDAGLKAMVVAAAPSNLELDYAGGTVSARLLPMPGMPWTLAVYYRKPLLDVVNFHFSVTAAVLAAAYIFTFMLLLAFGSFLRNALAQPGLTEHTFRKPIFLIPPWTFPRCCKGAVYIRITMIYLALGVLYLGVIYYLDIDKSLWWMLAVPAVIFWVWHWQVEPEYHRQPKKSVVWALVFPMPLLVTALVAYYVNLIYLHGGGSFLVYGLLVLLIFGALALWETVSLRRYGRTAEDPNKTFEERSAARARALKLTVRHYRYVACLFVIFLAVLPTLMFHNENYDVHEKLWVEFANWSNVDRIKARSLALESYADKMHLTRKVKPEEHANLLQEYAVTSRPEHGRKTRDVVTDFVLDDWKGVYLPRTRTYVLDGERVATACGKGGGAVESADPPAMYEWPSMYGDDKKHGKHEGESKEQKQDEIPFEMVPELISFLMVVNNLDAFSPACHPYIQFRNLATFEDHSAAAIEHQLRYLKALIKALPVLNPTGSILESFSDRSDALHIHGDGRHLSYVIGADRVIADKRSASFPGIMVMNEYDQNTGVHYLTSHSFPHTRSAYSSIVLLPYIGYIFLTGILVWLISGFMMRRQMATRLAGFKGDVDDCRLQEHIQSCAAFVVPVTRSMNFACQQLEAALIATAYSNTKDVDPKQKVKELQGKYLVPEQGQLRDFILRNEEAGILVVKDFTALIEERHKSRVALKLIEDFIEQYQAAEDEKALAAENADSTAQDEKAADSENTDGATQDNEIVVQEVRAQRLFVLSDIDPHYWLRHGHVVDNMSDDEQHRWDAVMRPLRIRTIARGEDVRVPPSKYRRAWDLCSPDERVILGGLHYERVLNYQNLASCISLYRRGLLRFREFQLHFDDDKWEAFVAQQITEDDFRASAGRYQNDLWVSVRGPLLVVLFFIVLFIAYVAQNEMRLIFSLIGTVGGALATIGMLSERFRDFRSYLGN